MSGIRNNWPAMERALRSILYEYKRGRLTAESALVQISTQIGDHTGRGYELGVEVEDRMQRPAAGCLICGAEHATAEHDIAE